MLRRMAPATTDVSGKHIASIIRVILSSETSVLTTVIQHNIPEGGILPSYRRENLKPYKVNYKCFIRLSLLRLDCENLMNVDPVQRRIFQFGLMTATAVLKLPTFIMNSWSLSRTVPVILLFFIYFCLHSPPVCLLMLRKWNLPDSRSQGNLEEKLAPTKGRQHVVLSSRQFTVSTAPECGATLSLRDAQPSGHNSSPGKIENVSSSKPIHLMSNPVSKRVKEVAACSLTTRFRVLSRSRKFVFIRQLPPYAFMNNVELKTSYFFAACFGY
jgi:hypothetical protein